MMRRRLDEGSSVVEYGLMVVGVVAAIVVPVQVLQVTVGQAVRHSMQQAGMHPPATTTEPAAP